MKQRSFLFVISLLPALLAFTVRYSATRPIQQPSPVALAYFEEAFSLIQQNAYFHKHLNFKTLKRQALSKMDTAQTYADTYDAIRFVLAQLQDNHSFFQPPSKDGQNAFSRAAINNQRIPFDASVVDGHYGLLRLRSYNSTNAANSNRISDSLYSCLAEFGRKKVKGIILDMRMMEGGTYIPFLAGMAPLIDAEQLIGFSNRNGKRSQVVRYKNGIYYKTGRKKSRLGSLSTYSPLDVAGLPIAILTGQYTASAGEMLLVSFLGLPNVSLFGQPTYGVPTGKANERLRDDALLSITSSACYDRQNITHTGSIQPNVICGEEEAPAFAKRWIDTAN